MKYMLMMHHGGEGTSIINWPPQDIKAHIEFMIQLEMGSRRQAYRPTGKSDRMAA